MEEMSKNIVINNLSKVHGSKEILKGISFDAKNGRITAFLGPNGAGKSSTLRILLGLDKASKGHGKFGDSHYSSFRYPLKVIGASFDGIGGSATRMVKTHMRFIAQSNDIPKKRIDETLKLVGLENKKRSLLGTLSLGEGQRLGLAVALLGDPAYLVLDEPTNGLDPMGIRWFRSFIKEQSNRGKTILLSSHLLSEVEAIADDVVIINHGSIVTKGSLSEVKEHLESLEDLFFQVTEGSVEK